MNCWLCGLRMRSVTQRTVPTYWGYWECTTCEVQSSLPGVRRKAFKAGSRFVAEIRSILFWDGNGAGEDHYTEIFVVDHGMVRGAYL